MKRSAGCLEISWCKAPNFGWKDLRTWRREVSNLPSWWFYLVFISHGQLGSFPFLSAKAVYSEQTKEGRLLSLTQAGEYTPKKSSGVENALSLPINRRLSHDAPSWAIPVFNVKYICSTVNTSWSLLRPLRNSSIVGSNRSLASMAYICISISSRPESWPLMMPYHTGSTSQQVALWGRSSPAQQGVPLWRRRLWSCSTLSAKPAWPPCRQRKQ